jgi:SOS-response transcriptional repressor LexA
MLGYGLETCYTEGVMGTLNPETAEKIYRFISVYITEYGYPPSLRELSKGCYISVASVIRYLDRLEAQGRLRRNSNVSRGITLLDEKQE